jgi:YbbR domain-containing protein
MMKFARFLLSNVVTLVLSLILAILIWVNASQTEDPTQDRWLQITLDYVGQPDQSVLLSAVRQSVQIFFEGPASVVNGLGANDFVAVVDLSRVSFGQEELVQVQVRSLVSGVTILSQPEPVNVLLEQLVTLEVEVELDVRGEVARGHVQGEALIDPQTIAVSGAASSVETLDRARVTVFLSNDRDTIVESAQPIFYDRQGRVASVSGLSMSTDQIQITIPVNEAANYAEKFIAIDLVGEPAPGYRLLSVKAEPPSVLVQGSPTQISALTQVRTELVDITGLTASFRQKVSLALPTGIALDEVVEIFVDVEIEPFLTTRPYNRGVLLQGLAEDLVATVDPESVRVVLFGPLPILETLLDEEVRLTLDLFDLDVGIYSLEPEVDFPDRGIELRSVQPSLVSVNITRMVTITSELTRTLPITVTSSTRPFRGTLMGSSMHPELLSFVYLTGMTPLDLPKHSYL